MKIAILAAAAALSMTIPAPQLGTISAGAAVHADGGKQNKHQRKHERKHERQHDRQQDGNYYQDQRYSNQQGNYDRRLSRNDQVWRGNDGQYRCRRSNGTVGTVIGGALGAIAGSEVAGRRNRTIGAIVGAVGGGLLGRTIDRGGLRCR